MLPFSEDERLSMLFASPSFLKPQQLMLLQYSRPGCGAWVRGLHSPPRYLKEFVIFNASRKTAHTKGLFGDSRAFGKGDNGQSLERIATRTATTNSTTRESISYKSGGEGGILTQPLSVSYHLFSNMHATRMNIGDFYDLALFNSVNSSA